MRDDYSALYQQFRWHIDDQFNVAQVCSSRWARSTKHRDRPAIIVENENGSAQTVSYRELEDQANRLANALQALGVDRGDRVAILLPQSVETAAAHLGVYKRAAVAMPMSILFGPDAMVYRLQDSDAKVAIVDETVMSALGDARASCPHLRHIIVVRSTVHAPRTHGPGEVDWSNLLAESTSRYHQQITRADEPFNLIYTSGTTGAPKGALIAHRSLIGNLTGFVASQNWMPRQTDVFWSPADWAWTGGLLDALLPTLYFGLPIVAFRGRFSAAKALDICIKHQVTNSFIFPTAMKMMMKEWHPNDLGALKLRAIMCAGESVGQTVFDWTEQTLGFTVNEMFGQTELNYVVGNSANRWPALAGAMGRAYPGHRVDVIDEAGQVVPDGELGEVAVNRYDVHGAADPVVFLGYWRNEASTQAKYTGDWCRTGDLAQRDAQGYLWYSGRADDMFKAAGYRIGPGEVENCLIQHPSVMNAAVVPKPDRERGNVVKAYIVLADVQADRSETALLALREQLQQHVRGKLAPYEYPKEIEFIDALPMTTTGKVQRRVLRLQEQERMNNG
jgi:acetyl-CoA synthetase